MNNELVDKIGASSVSFVDRPVSLIKDAWKAIVSGSGYDYVFDDINEPWNPLCSPSLITPVYGVLVSTNCDWTAFVQGAASQFFSLGEMRLSADRLCSRYLFIKHKLYSATTGSGIDIESEFSFHDYRNSDPVHRHVEFHCHNGVQEFKESGDRLLFEDVAYYSSNRVANRLPAHLLLSYGESLGIDMDISSRRGIAVYLDYGVR